MSTITPHIAALVASSHPGRVAYRVPELARAFDCTGSNIRWRFALRRCAFVKLPEPHEIALVLGCDVQPHAPWTGPWSEPLPDPRTWLHTALAERPRWRLSEVADMLGVSHRTIWRIVESGELPASQAGWQCCHWIRSGYLAEFLLEHRTPSRWEVQR